MTRSYLKKFKIVLKTEYTNLGKFRHYFHALNFVIRRKNYQAVPFYGVSNPEKSVRRRYIHLIAHQIP